MTTPSPSSATTRPTSCPEAEQPLVVIVDDDASIREGLEELLLSAGLRSASFASIKELIASDILDTPGCLILDVRMPGVSGLDFQQQLTARGKPKQIVFLTGHGDIPMTVQAMKAGAVDFLTKPVRDQTLLDAVSAAIARDAAHREQVAILSSLRARFQALTIREREVLAEVAAGRLNKQIAFALGISEVTVKLHRSNAMRKMEMKSVSELALAWTAIGSPSQVLLVN